MGVLVILGVACIAVGPWSLRICGAVLVVVCGWILTLAAKSGFRARPFVVIGSRGLEQRSVGFIAWEDIKALTITRHRYGRHLNIELVDEDSYLERLPVHRRALTPLRRASSYSLVSIPEATLDVTAEQVRDQIELAAGRTWPH